MTEIKESRHPWRTPYRRSAGSEYGGENGRDKEAGKAAREENSAFQTVILRWIAKRPSKDAGRGLGLSPASSVSKS